MSNLKHRVFLMTSYSGGLRVSETAQLKPHDIDRQRMQIHVRQGKGKKDRYTLLSKTLLENLRDYYRLYRPTVWLFPGQRPDKAIDIGSMQRVFKRAKESVGIVRPATFHTLFRILCRARHKRHSFATHMLEDGADIFTLKKLLGHNTTMTTMIYLHIRTQHMQKIISPLDRIEEDE